MIDDITKIVLTAFVITAVAIAVKPGAQTSNVIGALTNGVVGMQKAATGA